MSTTEASPTQETQIVEVLPPFIGGEVVSPELANSVKNSVNQVLQLDPEHISIRRGFNARNFDAVINETRVKDMTHDLAQNGQLNPVRVLVENTEDGPRIVLVSGETRLRAMLKLREGKGASKFPSIKAILAEDKSEKDRLIEMYLDNPTSSKFRALEILNLVQRLTAEGMKVGEVAKRLDSSHTTVRNISILAWATLPIVEAINKDLLSEYFVIEALRPTEGDPKKILEAEKKLLKLAKKREEGGETKLAWRKETEPREEDPNAIMFNRVVFNGFISTMQEVMEKLDADQIEQVAHRAGVEDPATVDALQQYAYSMETALRNALESANVFAYQAASADREAARKAKEDQDKATKAQATSDKAVAEANKAEAKATMADAKAKAEEAKKNLDTLREAAKAQLPSKKAKAKAEVATEAAAEAEPVAEVVNA